MDPDDPRHGENAGYLAGCREPCCRKAAARKEVQRRLAHMHGKPPTVPILGARRRIHALQALGWPPRLLSVHMGFSEDWLHATINANRSGRIYRRNHERIVALYDEFSMRPGPSEITRRRAAKAGWAVPLAWDDGEIDDPKARPRGVAKLGHITPRKADEDCSECPRCGVRRQVRVQARGSLCPDCRSAEREAS